MMYDRSNTGIKTKFTISDRRFLRENFFTLTNQELADSLRMSLTVVRNQCAKMGLKRVKVYSWTAKQTAFLIRHYGLMGDVEISELMNIRFPRKSRPWTRKHVAKKRMLLDLLRTPDQLAAIRERNTEQKRYNLDKAREVFQEKVHHLTDDYILSNSLRISKASRSRILSEHRLLIDLTRQTILKRRQRREAKLNTSTYAIQ